MGIIYDDAHAHGKEMGRKGHAIVGIALMGHDWSGWLAGIGLDLDMIG